MKLSALMLILFLAAPALAQVKKWVDENGVVHFEAQGTQGTEATLQPENAKPETRAKFIDRSQAGFTLGDHVSSLKASKKALPAPVDKNGAQIFMFFTQYLAPGVREMNLMYIQDRLAMISVTYFITKFVNWPVLVKTTISKYGEPFRSEENAKRWMDNEVMLTLTFDGKENVTIQTSYVSAMQKYLDAIKANAPKF